MQFRYAWCSDRLFNDDFIYSIRPHRYTDLIPTECDPNINPDDANWKPRLVLGHNVSFDRSYVMEQYLVQVKQYLKFNKVCFINFHILYYQ